MRILIITAVCLSVSVAAIAQDLKSKPQHERMLKGDDLKNVQEFALKINSLDNAGKRDEAAKVAEELLVTVKQILGEDHWQVRMVQIRIAVLRQPPQTPEQLKLIEESSKLNSEMMKLYQQGKYIEAKQFALQVLDIQKKVYGEKDVGTTASLSNLALMYHSHHAYTKAEPLYLESLRISIAYLGKNHPEIAVLYKNLATMYMLQGRYDLAESTLKEAVRIRTDVYGEKHPATVAYHKEMSTVSKLKNDINDIKKKPQHDRMIRGDAADKANELDRNIKLLDAMGKREDALNRAEELLAYQMSIQGEDHWQVRDAKNRVAELQQQSLSKKDQLRIDQSTALNEEVLKLNELGKHVEARRVAEVVLETFKELYGNAHRHTASAKLNLVNTLDSLGQYKQAETLCIDALSNMKSALGENHPMTAKCMNQLAILYTSQGKVIEAEHLYEVALQIQRDVRGPRHVETALTTNNLAELYRKQLNHRKAEPLYQLAFKIFEEQLGKQHRYTITCMQNIAEMYTAQGNYIKALPLLLEALRTMEQTIGEKQATTAIVKYNLAKLYGLQGNNIDADQQLLAAVEIQKEILGSNHPDTARSIHLMGDFCTSKMEYQRANQFYHECLKVYSEIYGTKNLMTVSSMSDVAMTEMLLGNSMVAEKMLKSALQIKLQLHGENHTSIATTLNQLAVLYQLQGKYADAEPLYNQALRICKDQLGITHPETASCQKNISFYYFEQGKYDSAYKVLTAATEAYEVSRRIHSRTVERSTGNHAQNPYPLLTATLIKLKMPLEAHRSFESNLARGYADQEMTFRETSLTEDERNKYKNMTSKVVSVQQQILMQSTLLKQSAEEKQSLITLTKELRVLENNLLKLDVEHALREISSTSDIQSAIPTDAVFVSWVDVADITGKLQEHWACVLRNTGEPKWEKLHGTGAKGEWTKDDTELPRQLRAAIVAGKDTTELTRKLYRQRMAPIEKHLTGAKTLYVASVNQMAGIPVEVLTDKYAISYIPSGTFLARLKDRPKPTNSQILAVGDPIYSATFQKGWAELPGTRVELNRLQTLFGKDNVTVFTDDKASESGLEALRLSNKLKNYKYLHFAMHGEANNFRAFDSNLILAHEKKAEKPFPEANAPLIDAKLSASEVLEYWKLDAELVTLSACETALGKSAGGDGLLGFAQAFLLAGSRSVCLSLWKVDDTATALLMDRFYANLLVS